MNRFWLFAGVLLLGGCSRRWYGAPNPLLDNGGTGGTTTITGSGGGQLLDGAGGQDVSCCVKDKIDPFEGPSWFVITGDSSPGTCPESTIEGLKGHAEMLSLIHISEPTRPY